MQLLGKRALVTGGGVRLGKAIALALADQRVEVAIHYNGSAEAATETLAELKQKSPAATAIQADFSKPESAATALFKTLRDDFGPVDFLINSAAIFESDAWPGISAEHVERHLGINMVAPLFLCREFTRQLPSDTRGHVVNIADWRAARPDPDHLVYSMAKAGLVALTKGLARAAGPWVQANAIAPGPILPPPGASREEFEKRAAGLPLQHPGSPRDITEAVCYLLASDFITGHVLEVTGGEQL